MLHARHGAEKTLFIKILVHRLFVRLIGDSLCADRETGNGPVWLYSPVNQSERFVGHRGEYSNSDLYGAFS